MNFIVLTKWWDLSFSLWLIVLNSILFGSFLWAFIRQRNTVFLIVAAGSLCFVYNNTFFTVENLFIVAHIRLFPPVIMRALYGCHVFIAAFGSILWLSGILGLLKLAMRNIISRPDAQTNL